MPARLLLVDDVARNLQLLEACLAPLGHELLLAGSGAEALQLFAKVEPDLVLLDLQMPDMDGLQLARAIKADPSLATIPLVLLTSVGYDHHAIEARQIGIAAYLTKPVRQSQLYDCLVTVVNGATDIVAARAPAPSAPVASPPVLTAPIAVDADDRRPRVLVAEDNAVNQKVAAHLLEARGLRVDLVSNGREALDALAGAPYALVFMDCQMPDMDGYESAAAIRARECGTQRTPIIAMTAGALAADREKCLAAGMDDYIAKPITRAALDTVLSRWLHAAPTSG